MNLLFPIKLSLYLLVLHTVWISARAGAHKRRRIRGPNVYLVTLQKDTEALSQWINYHGDIFGYDKLYILDGHSSEETLEELQSFEAVGVHTFHRHSKKLNQLASNLVGKSAFTFKRKHLSTLIRFFVLPHANNPKSEFPSFIVPIDMDEYIVAVRYDQDKRGSHPTFSMNKTDILKQFDQLPNLGKYAGLKFKFNTFNAIDCSAQGQQGLSSKQQQQHNVLSSFRTEFEYHEEAFTFFEEMESRRNCLSKTFFPSRGFIWTDMGNHYGEVLNETCKQDCADCYYQYMRSGLGLVHYSSDVMTYADTRRKMLSHFEASLQFKDVKTTADCAAFKLNTHYCKFKTKLDAKGDTHMYYSFIQQRQKKCDDILKSNSLFSSAFPSLHFKQHLGKNKGPHDNIRI